MAKNIKALLAQKLTENSQRHAAALQETEFDAGRQHIKIPIEQIDPNPYQPRRVFPQSELEALAASIAESGLLQPISVRRVGDRYQLIAGERRWRAHRLLGRPTIEALVSPAEESDLAVLALVENIDREDLSDYEIGKALRQVENLFPTRKKLAEAIGLNREDMYRYFSFESLPEAIRGRLEENPRLMSRAAAADVKRALSKIQPLELGEELLERAWRLLESEIEQSRVAGFLIREAKANREEGVAPHRESQKLARDGRTVGSISRDAKHLVVKLNAADLDADQEAKLRGFIEKLIAGAV